jgi:methyl-accepting chemotaxis protein
MQVLVGIAAVLTAFGTIWKLFFKPMAEIITLQQLVLPLLRDLARSFGGVVTPFDVLKDIISEFRTNGGSSLRDVVNRLEDAATDHAAAAELLKVQVESSRQLAVQDREQLTRLLLNMDRLTVKTDASEVSRHDEAQRVQENLAVAQQGVDDVAHDLDDARRRADATSADGSPGEAADAASRSDPK